ncbi:Probable O-methyltransferase 3 [Linum grandiflorum]
MDGGMTVERAVELLEAQTKVWDHSFGYINTMAVQCAIELGIPDVIHKHPLTLGELVAALEIPPTKSSFLSRLMRMLVHLGYFIILEDEEEEKYGKGPLCDLLVKENPFNARSFLLTMNDPVMVEPWRHMSSWFRSNVSPTEQPPFSMANGGKKIYQVISEDPRFAQLFTDAVGRDSLLFSKALVVNCKASFEGFKSLVDVGGNTGITAMAIADAFSDIDCTTFDLPHVVSGLEPGTRHNFKFVGGDMFKEIPSADIVLLKWVLIDWGEESCLEILKQSKKAVTRGGGRGGKVMIIDHVLGHESWSDKASTGTLLLLDMGGISCVEGVIRTEKEWAKLFSDAGFSKYTISPVHGLRALIEVYP